MLNLLNSRDLAPLAVVDHHFHQLIARILHRRVMDVASLPHNDLILECYHPIAKLTTPYYACRYEGTRIQGEDACLGNVSPAMTGLQKVYSSFRPVMAEENRRTRNRNRERSPPDDTLTEDIFLDEDKLFSQLCAVTTLVKMGPRRGLFLSHVNMSDAIIRVWRHWLARAAEADSKPQDGIIWVGDDHAIGIRFQVTYGPSERMPVITGPDDHPPVFYKLQYEGKELPVPSLFAYANVRCLNRASSADHQASLGR